MFLLSFTTDWTDWTDLNPLNLLNSLNSYLVVRQKQYKPLAVDADVSFEPLMLQLSENPQASLDIFC